MDILALDLSKSSTGWAILPDGADRPRYGHWVLGSEFSSDGMVFAKLHTCLTELYMVIPFDFVFIEEPIHPAQLTGHTNIGSIRLAAGLASHAESFAHAFGCRSFQMVNVEKWRPDFLGRDLVSDTRRMVRARAKRMGKKLSARDKLKQLTIDRCRDLGFSPKTNDEADALGILDYACWLRGITPPWRSILENTLEAAG